MSAAGSCAGPRPGAGVAPAAWERQGPDTAQHAIEIGALRDWVRTALERLSEPQRLAVTLRYFTSASSYEAIPDICGVPVGTVRSRLSAAKRKLAENCSKPRPRRINDFQDGVRSRLGKVIAGGEITIVEAWLESPPEQPLHCPPALTQIHFHRGGPTSRIISHYAPRPAA
jgi:hypothetical protein